MKNLKNIMIILIVASLLSCVENKIANSEEKVVEEFNTSLLIQLYDIWGLKKVKGKNIQKGKGVILELNTKEMTFNGRAYCNNMFGELSSENSNEINFLNIGATRMMCPEIKLEQEYFQILRNVKSYKFKGLNLLFFNDKNELVLEFIKID